MRRSHGLLALTFLLLSVVLKQAAAQDPRPDSRRWYVGFQAGGLLFETQTQKRSTLPFGGVHVLVMARRAGLAVAIEEGFGSGERSAYADPDEPNGVRGVRFDRLRKYTATLMAFPVTGTVEPYVGLGFGILHTVNTEVQGFFTSPEDAGVATLLVKDLGSTGIGSLLGGAQYRVSPNLVLFGHYQITTSPADGRLLRGPSHTVALGIRLGLGSAREEVRGAGRS